MAIRQQDRYSLWILAWPIFIELFLQFLLGAVDTLMVSRISDNAVAVVGFSNQIFNALTTLFATVSGGAGILITQRLGAGKNEEGRRIAIVALMVTASVGIFISLWMFMDPLALAVLLRIPPELYEMTEVYISIVGGGMLLTALMAVLGTAIRNTGNTKGPMYIAVGINIIHVLLNYGFIYGALGLPQLGLQGVAISTVVSRLLAVIVLAYLFVGAFDRRMKLSDWKLFELRLLKDVLHIGWPMGLGSASWLLTQLLIYSYVAQLGAVELAARTYMSTLEAFSAVLGFSLAMAGQIQIAHLYGAGRMQDAYKAAYRILFIGLGLVTINALLILLFGKPVLGLFTDNKEIVAIGVSLLAINVILQPSKMLNMGIQSGLNGVGDTRFVMFTSVITMWVVAAGASYYFGVHLGYGLMGIYACMICDELIRGFFVLYRWKQRKVLKRAEAKLALTMNQSM